MTRGEVNAVAGPTANFETDPEADNPQDDPSTGQSSVDSLALASVGLSAISFLTFFKLADRKATPLRALGYFLMTSTESITGTVLGVIAVRRAQGAGQSTRGLVLGAAGAVLGVFTTLLNFNFMRTRSIE